MKSGIHYVSCISIDIRFVNTGRYTSLDKKDGSMVFSLPDPMFECLLTCASHNSALFHNPFWR